MLRSLLLVLITLIPSFTLAKESTWFSRVFEIENREQTAQSQDENSLDPEMYPPTTSPYPTPSPTEEESSSSSSEEETDAPTTSPAPSSTPPPTGEESSSSEEEQTPDNSQPQDGLPNVVAATPAPTPAPTEEESSSSSSEEETDAPTASPGESNVPDDSTSTCAENEAEVGISITFDNYPTEVTWSLKNKCTDEIVLSGGDYEVEDAPSVSTVHCLPKAKYDFIIFDNHGDGICCEYGNGQYDITYQGLPVGSGGDFEKRDNVVFGECVEVAPDSQCALEGKVSLDLEIIFDDYPGETSWELVNECTQELEAEGSDYQSHEPLVKELCIEDVKHTFTIFDSHGDGMCCSHGTGQYHAEYKGAVVAHGSEFKNKVSKTFGDYECGAIPAKCVSEGKVLFDLYIHFDEYPKETSWSLINECTNELVAEGSGYEGNEDLTEELCIEDVKHTFSMFDNHGDGLCCDHGIGEYHADFKGLTLVQGGDFTDEEKKTFGDCPMDAM